MNEFEFQFPWVLALLGLLPVYALLRGKVGRLSALTFSSAEIARAAGAQARAAAGRFLFFLRLLVVALTIGALPPGRAWQFTTCKQTRPAWTSCSCWICRGP